ncbi:hypothetical protein HIM_08525 [Hirsutella minnesotensis 3608]|uniref:Myb-like domain-containing protein n=1 Tax=Hirsutella minnesotensis 3608 TaxID=1043627 RepID=A0A0F7ZMH8_9HYPO|nr:hypothetical protein HIM_08525 [Hirsutella minnesotensis 3608]
MTSVQAHHSPLHRHDGGVTKSKKIALTGSGRAWREDEEAYLLQTRLQKMPYKHIAAHLNKTELACRLHYHQLSHGSARRKRATSCSSGSSDPASAHQGLAPSPIGSSKARSLSPALPAGGYLPTPGGNDMQLPSIMNSDRSPRLPAILPKPEQMGYQHRGESPPRYPMIMAEKAHEPLPPVNLSRSSTPYHSPAPALRLDCSSSRLATPSASIHGPAHVDLARLQVIYEAHRNAFWGALADEYGANTSPATLEQAWKTSSCCPRGGSTLVTPTTSPDNEPRSAYTSAGHDKTRISSILGVDREPMVRPLGMMRA